MSQKPDPTRTPLSPRDAAAAVAAMLGKPRPKMTDLEHARGLLAKNAARKPQKGKRL